MSLPVMSPEQRAEALAKAAESRRIRAAALARVRSGEITLADVVADEESPLQKARVSQLVLAVPGVGKAKAGALFGELGINPKRRVQGLGSRQRQALAERFPAAA